MISAATYAATIRFFLAPVVELLDDPEVTEILINGPGQIYYERDGRLYPSDARFTGESQLLAAARNIAEYVGRTLDEENVSADARLPDGSRVHIMMPPCSRQGICLSIRKFYRKSFDLDRLVEFGSLTAEVADFLKMVVHLRKTTLVSGGTATGKTSFLNALSAEIPDEERVIVIEDNTELQLRLPHVLYLESRPANADGRGEKTIRSIFSDSLRMHPTRIIVGEVRNKEALDMVQAALSGHSGTMSTVHANDPTTALVRLETLCLEADVGLPAPVARMQVAHAIQVVVQLARDERTGARRVNTVGELIGLDEGGFYKVRTLYRFAGRGRAINGHLLGSLERVAIPTFHSEPYDLGLADRIGASSPMFAPATSG